MAVEATDITAIAQSVGLGGVVAVSREVAARYVVIDEGRFAPTVPLFAGVATNLRWLLDAVRAGLDAERDDVGRLPSRVTVGVAPVRFDAVEGLSSIQREDVEVVVVPDGLVVTVPGELD